MDWALEVSPPWQVQLSSRLRLRLWLWQQCFLPCDGAISLLHLQSLSAADWLGRGVTIIPAFPASISQRAWDDPVCSAQFDHLLWHASEGSRARLLACRSASSFYWLSALPLANLGLCLGDAETRISVGLRLGAPIFIVHNCIWRAKVDSDGLHDLPCRWSASRHSRHTAINSIVALTLSKADTPARLEPTYLVRMMAGDPMKPLWYLGLPVILDRPFELGYLISAYFNS